MRKLYAEQEVADRGTTTWHNPTEHTLRIKVFGNNGPARAPLIVEPGAEVEFDSGYDVNMESICPLLKQGPAPKASSISSEDSTPGRGVPPERTRPPKPPAGG